MSRLRFNDEEGGMAKAQLLKIENYAGRLNDMIHPDDELESWVQAKLAVVAATMGDIKHYLDYELKQMGAGGIASDNTTPYEIEFTWDKKNNDFDSRKVNVYAENADDAKAKVTAKFSKYYSGFRIVDVKQDSDGEAGQFKLGGTATGYKYEGSTWYEDLREAEQLIGSERWKKMSRDDRMQSTKYLKAKGAIGFYAEEEDVETLAASQYNKGGGM